MFIIVFSNTGGELERVEATTGEEAATKLRDMLDDLELVDGDTFTVTETEEE